MSEAAPWPAGLSAPARRALVQAGYGDVAALTSARFVDLAALHGVGPKALDLLTRTLHEQGLEYAEPAPTSQRAWARAMQGRSAQDGKGTAATESGLGATDATAREGAGAGAGATDAGRAGDSADHGAVPVSRPAGTGERAAAAARRRSAARHPGAGSTSKAPPVELEVEGRAVKVSSPDRIYFPDHGWTKLDVVHYYLAVSEGITRALLDRPTMLHRFPKGLAGDKVFQKRIPPGAPPWVQTVRLHFPRYGLHADELCVTEPASVIWAAQMSTVEFHPWNVRRDDVDRPDEWRIDLDPMPQADFAAVRRVAHVAHQVLDDLGIVGYPKTSGGNGIHIYVRIRPQWGFAEVRRAAWGFAREVERRLPDDVTTAWWRRDRDPSSVFIDYNQNARDHTIASAYSLRGNPDGTVSTPIRWDEIDTVVPRDFTLATVPARFAELGDLFAPIDDVEHGLDELLEWADRFEREDGAAIPDGERAGGDAADGDPANGDSPRRSKG